MISSRALTAIVFRTVYYVYTDYSYDNVKASITIDLVAINNKHRQGHAAALNSVAPTTDAFGAVGLATETTTVAITAMNHVEVKIEKKTFYRNLYPHIDKSHCTMKYK